MNIKDTREITETLKSIHESVGYIQNLFDPDMSFEKAANQVFEMIGRIVSVDKIIIGWRSQEQSFCADFYFSGNSAAVSKSKKEIIDYLTNKIASEIRTAVRGVEPVEHSEIFSFINDHEKNELDLHNPLLFPISFKGTFLGGLLCDRISREEWNKTDRAMIVSVCDYLALALQSEINRAELGKAKLIAEQANSSKNDFLSRMSHELRTPLSAVLGMTKIGEEAKSLDKAHKCIGSIEKASKQLLVIINDVLDMAKIGSSKLTITNDVFNLEKMLLGIAEDYSIKTDERNQDFRIHIDLNAPKFFYGDVMRISQVITGLLSNAVKFSPRGGEISLDVTLLKTIEDVANMRFRVKDNGIGIRAEMIRKLFDPFEQIDGGRSRKYGGTGLGLTLSKRIVEMMGGELNVESTPGQGSVFSFTIPLSIYREEHSTVKKLQGTDITKINVLLIDDDPATREYFIKTMRSFKIKAKACGSYIEAIEKIDSARAVNKPFDIIFVDYFMPDINGLEVIKKLRQRRENSVIIMVSSADKSDFMEEAKDMGIYKFITKPLFPSMMLDEINDVLGVPEKTWLKYENQYDFSGITILIAEDAKINRDTLHKMLCETGINMVFAQNGESALQSFNKGQEIYDIVFMDIEMPVLDGFEATKGIRALPFKYAKSIPIIAMTANTLPEDIKKCLDAGMNDHTAKPFEINDLIEKIIKYGTSADKTEVRNDGTKTERGNTRVVKVLMSSDVGTTANANTNAITDADANSAANTIAKANANASISANVNSNASADVGSNMKDASMKEANVKSANMKDASVKDADVKSANMKDASVKSANMKGASMKDADVKGANMKDANAKGSNMKGASMKDANVKSANMKEAGTNVKVITEGIAINGINDSGIGKGILLKNKEQEVGVMAQNDMADSEIKKYVNYEEALERVRGNTRVYKTLLKSFSQNTYLGKLKEEMERQDNQASAATAHVIKGVTANLSLTVIYDIIVTLESQLKNNYDARESLKNFEEALEKTLACINIVLEKIQ